jgi:integrase
VVLRRSADTFGAKMVQTLTDLAIRSLSEGILYDGRIPAFGIRAGKTRKTWFLIKGANRTKVTLGHYPDLSLAEARKRALAALAAVEAIKVTTPTFQEALSEFYEKHVSTIRPLSAYQIKRILNRHFTWTKPLDKITHNDVVETLEQIEATSERAHAHKDITTFFNWCVPRYLKASPCVGIKKATAKSRERVLTDEELSKVWHRAKEIGYPYGTIVQLLILCGQRAGETAALRWEWITDENISIPADITKNGRSTTVPLGRMAKEVIETVPRFNPMLFPARGVDKPFTGFGVMKISLDKCGVKNFTHHDLRRTFATNMAKLGVRLEVTEKLLNHVSGSTGGIVAVYMKYNFQSEMREAIEKHETFLKQVLQLTD